MPTSTSLAKLSATDIELLVEWKNTYEGQISKYHHIWLRDNCHCDECYYAITKQRLLNSAAIRPDIQPTEFKIEDDKVIIVWNQDNHRSEYSIDWLIWHSYNPKLIPIDSKVKGEKEILQREYWDVQYIKDHLPKVDFDQVMKSSDETDQEDAIKDWCLKIWKHGFCLIDNVPVDPKDTEALCEKLMFIRPTHYGGFWDFTSDLAKADTAYTNLDVGSHTDGTYWSDTPGLQLFHLLYHDGTGGTTSLTDAFYCASILRKKHPESFELLSKVPIPAHSAGEEKVCIQPDIPQPIFKLDNQGELIQVRWNQSDRSTMNDWENPQDVLKFYEALRNWYLIISDPENEFFYQLKPGQCLIFDNWRCFHSRTEFTGKRRLCGAYITRDDFVSRLKILNLGRQAVLDSI